VREVVEEVEAVAVEVPEAVAVVVVNV